MHPVGNPVSTLPAISIIKTVDVTDRNRMYNAQQEN